VISASVIGGHTRPQPATGATRIEGHAFNYGQQAALKNPGPKGYGRGFSRPMPAQGLSLPLGSGSNFGSML
jgi:hypothetical protein